MLNIENDRREYQGPSEGSRPDASQPQQRDEDRGSIDLAVCREREGSGRAEPLADCQGPELLDGRSMRGGV